METLSLDVISSRAFSCAILSLVACNAFDGGGSAAAASGMSSDKSSNPLDSVPACWLIIPCCLRSISGSRTLNFSISAKLF